MKRYYAILWAILLFVLQTTVIPRVSISGIQINLLLIGIVLFALIGERSSAVKFTITVGLLQDIFTAKALGMNLFIYVVLLILLLLFKQMFLSEQGLSIVIAMLLSTWLYHLIMYIVSIFLLDQTRSFVFVISVGFIESLFNAIAIFVFHSIFQIRIRNTH
jgi:rod shape-determining protein MreD